MNDKLPIQINDVDTDLDTDLDVSVHVMRLIHALQVEQGISSLLHTLSIQHKHHFRTHYLNPAMQAGLIEMTEPSKPTSRHQKYRLTPRGTAYQKWLLQRGQAKE